MLRLKINGSNFLNFGKTADRRVVKERSFAEKKR